MNIVYIEFPEFAKHIAILVDNNTTYINTNYLNTPISNFFYEEI